MQIIELKERKNMFFYLGWEHKLMRSQALGYLWLMVKPPVTAPQNDEPRV